MHFLARTAYTVFLIRYGAAHLQKIIYTKSVVQARVPAHWEISSEGVWLLNEKLAVPPSLAHWAGTQIDPNPDVRYDTRMKTQAAKFYVKVAALVPANLCASRRLRGGRGLFDERVKIARRRGWNNGWRWTDGVDRELWVPDSYSESDYSLWADRQQERDRSLTLDVDQQELMSS